MPKIYKSLPPMTQDGKDLLFSWFYKFRIKRIDQCGWAQHIWTGALNTRGYGVTTFRGYGQFLAHGVIFMLIHDEDIRCFELHHLCGNPACVNPDHVIPLPPWEHSKLTRETGAIGKIQSRDPVHQEALDEIRELYFEQTLDELGIT